MNSSINSKQEKIFQFFWSAFFILNYLCCYDSDSSRSRCVLKFQRSNYGGQGSDFPDSGLIQRLMQKLFTAAASYMRLAIQSC